MLKQNIKNLIKRIIGSKNTFLLKLFILNFESLILLSRKSFIVKEKNVWLISTTSHNNIGDLAITKAEVEFLNDYYKDYNLININDREFYILFKKIKKNIKDSDIVFIHGGGNMGNEYFILELQRWKIIEKIKKNKIIILPQTVFVSDEYNAIINKKKYMSLAKKIYEQSNVYIFTRERFSYNFMKTNFANTRIYLIPDIVLRLKHTVNSKKRNDIVFCFRDDFEKVVSNNFIHSIENLFNDSYKIEKTSMIYVGDKDVIKFQNEIILNKLDEFSKYKLCITDRLHAMIFCTIVGTPCIAFNNHSKKVEGVYKWIKELPYIKVVNSFEEFKIALNGIEWDNNKIFEYNLDFENLYKKIFNISMEN